MNFVARDILEKAQREGYALGAFNAANIETIKAIVQAAANLRAPVIIESSPGETTYFGAQNLADVLENYSEEYGIPILINLDHGPSYEACEAAIQAGYHLTHIDAGEVEDWDAKIALTKRVVEAAHAKGLLVEGETDHIAGSSSVHSGGLSIEELVKHYTDPDRAAEYVKATGVDTFASFVGNLHGVFDINPDLDIPRLVEIKNKTGCFLSLHGGSGIPDDQVRAAIEQGGIVKVNVNTEMRQAYRVTLEKVLAESKEMAIYKLMPPVIEAVQAVVEMKIRLFGSAGKA